MGIFQYTILFIHHTKIQKYSSNSGDTSSDAPCSNAMAHQLSVILDEY